MTLAISPAQVLAGEATSGTEAERWQDMLNIASVMYNRSIEMKTPLESVVSAINPANKNKEFDAYGKALPAGVGGSLVQMAQQALDHVQKYGPINQATFYSTPATQDNLPGGLVEVSQSKGHVFKADPQNRSILTAAGFKVPNPANLGIQATAVTPTAIDPAVSPVDPSYAAAAQNSGILSAPGIQTSSVSTTSEPAKAVDAAFQPNGLLSGNYPSASFTADPSNVPAGYLEKNGLLSSIFSPAETAPVDVKATGLLGAAPDLSASANAAAATPENFDARFGAPDPVTASATGALGASPDLSAATSAAALSQPGFDARFGTPNPIDVAASGLLGTTPGLTADANAAASTGPNFNDRFGIPSPVDVAASGILGTTPGLSANANAAAMTPANFASNFGPSAVQQVMQTPTSYMDQPTEVAADQTGINSPEMQQRIQSAKDQLAAMEAAKQQVNPALTSYQPTDVPTAAQTAIDNAATAAKAPTVVEPAAQISGLNPTGLLGTTPGLDANAATSALSLNSQVNPAGLLSTTPGLAATATVPAINTPSLQTPSTVSLPGGLLSPSSLETSKQQLSSIDPNAGLLTGAVTPNYQQYQSFVPSDVQPISAPVDTAVQAPAYNPLQSYQPSYAPANDLNSSYQSVTKPQYSSLVSDAFPEQTDVNVPSLQTVSVPDQPNVSVPDTTVAGPAKSTIDAPTQQQTTTATTKQAPTHSIFNGGTLAGGLLGGLAAGPAGGLLGGLLGNAINGGLLSGPTPTTQGGINIGSGLANVQSIYDGAAALGSTANTNNGGMVTSLPGGFTRYTNSLGVSTITGPNGQQYADWTGGIFNGSNSSSGQPASGGGSFGSAA